MTTRIPFGQIALAAMRHKAIPPDAAGRLLGYAPGGYEAHLLEGYLSGDEIDFLFGRFRIDVFALSWAVQGDLEGLPNEVRPMTRALIEGYREHNRDLVEGVIRHLPPAGTVQA